MNTHVREIPTPPQSLQICFHISWTHKIQPSYGFSFSWICPGSQILPLAHYLHLVFLLSRSHWQCPARALREYIKLPCPQNTCTSTYVTDLIHPTMRTLRPTRKLLRAWLTTYCFYLLHMTHILKETAGTCHTCLFVRWLQTWRINVTSISRFYIQVAGYRWHQCLFCYSMA